MKRLAFTTSLTAALLILGTPPSWASPMASVLLFQDNAYASVGSSTQSQSSAYIAAPPTASTAHNYAIYNTGEEVRVYATATTAPGMNLDFRFGDDGYASYSLHSIANASSALMKVGESFRIQIQVTNPEASWQALTLQARSGMRYSMYTYERYNSGGGLNGNEYMHLFADYSLRVDGQEVWERGLDLRMDASGAHPYAFLSNINPPNAANEPLLNIALGSWAPHETRLLEFSFDGFAETNADATTHAFMSLAPIFNAFGLSTAPGQPRPPITGGPAAQVPEPPSAALALGALALAGALTRRRRPA